MSAPIIGARTVPVKTRLALSLVITIAIMPMIPPVPSIDPFSLASIYIIFQQILIGLSMGFALQLVFSSVVTGGQIIAMQMGLGFASMIDPQNGQQVPVLGQLYLLMATLIFLALNGHLILIEVLANSFVTLPISILSFGADGLWSIVLWGSQMFEGAVWLALPAITSLLIVNIAFGVMARAAPQLNIFAIGFPITMMMGFMVILFVMPMFLPQFTHLLESIFILVNTLVVRS